MDAHLLELLGVGTAGAAAAGAAVYFVARRKGGAGKPDADPGGGPPPVRNPARFFNQRVLSLLEQQEKLLKRHEMLPFHDLDYKEPMAGETLAEYNRVRDAIQGVRTSWLGLMDTQEQLDAIAGPDEEITSAQYREIAAVLGQADPDAVEQQLEQCRGAVDALEQAHEAIAPVQARIEAELAAVTSDIETLTGAGVERLPLGPQWDQLRQLADTAMAGSVADPVGLRDSLVETEAQLAQVAGRLRALRESHDLELACQERLCEFRDTAARLRDEGIPLEEAVANPDMLLEEARRELEIFAAAFRAGDVDTAVRSVGLAREALDEAGRRIEGSLEAKSFVEEELPQRRNEIGRLEREAGTAQADLDELARRFDRESWAEIEAPVLTGRDALSRMEPDLDEARRLHDDKQFITAANLVEQVLERQEELRAYFRGPRACIERLEEIAAGGVQRLAALTAQHTQLAAMHDQHESSLPEHFGPSLQDLQRWLAATGEATEAERPNWSQIERALAEAERQAAALSQEAGEVTAALEEIGGRARDLRRQATDTGTFLANHEADRPRANQLHAGASAALEEFLQALGGSRKDIATLRRELDHIEVELRDARATAERDLQLDQHATNVVAQAGKVLQEVRGFNRFGVTPRTSAAEAAMRRARETHRRQEYERVPELALAAEQAANQAYEQAVEEARRREEQERRRRQDNLKQVVSVGAMIGAQILGQVVNARMHGHRRPYHHRRRTFF